ncbi:MAG: hypothetical protein ACOCXQ_04200 [Patescibacteria group bacterium]
MPKQRQSPVSRHRNGATTPGSGQQPTEVQRYIQRLRIQCRKRGCSNDVIGITRNGTTFFCKHGHRTRVDIYKRMNYEKEGHLIDVQLTEINDLLKGGNE